MKEEYRDFAARFARAVIDGNFTAAHALFAPWLQRAVSTDALRQAIEEKLRELNEEWDVDALIYPSDFSVSGNSSTLQSLREECDWRPPRPIAPAVTDENFRQWMFVQFLPDEDDERIEFDAWFDCWFILVETEGEPRIGYFELEDVD